MPEKKKKKATWDSREAFAKRVFNLLNRSLNAQLDAKTQLHSNQAIKDSYLFLNALVELLRHFDPDPEKTHKMQTKVFKSVNKSIKFTNDRTITYQAKKEKKEKALSNLKILYRRLYDIAFKANLVIPTKSKEEIEPSKAPYQGLEG